MGGNDLKIGIDRKIKDIYYLEKDFGVFYGAEINLELDYTFIVNIRKEKHANKLKNLKYLLWKKQLSN